jgi:hypothetical protein
VVHFGESIAEVIGRTGSTFRRHYLEPEVTIVIDHSQNTC